LHSFRKTVKEAGKHC